MRDGKVLGNSVMSRERKISQAVIRFPRLHTIRMSIEGEFDPVKLAFKRLYAPGMLMQRLG